MSAPNSDPVATIRWALDKGRRSDELLDGRDFDPTYWQDAADQLAALVARLKQAERMAERGQDAETEKIERGTHIAELESALKNMEAERDKWHDEWMATALGKQTIAAEAECEVLRQQRGTLAELLRHIQEVIRTVAPLHPLLDEIDGALGYSLVVVDPSASSLAVPRFAQDGRINEDGVFDVPQEASEEKESHGSE